MRTSSPRSSDRIHRCASGLGGAPCAASRNFFSHPLAMLKRSVTALTMSRSLLTAAGSHVVSPVQVAPPCTCLSARRRSFCERVAPRKTGARLAFSLRLSRFAAKISNLAEVLPSVRALMSSALARRGPRHASSIRKTVSDFKPSMGVPKHTSQCKIESSYQLLRTGQRATDTTRKVLEGQEF